MSGKAKAAAKPAQAAGSKPGAKSGSKKVKKIMPWKVARLLVRRTTRPQGLALLRRARKLKVAPETLVPKKHSYRIKKIGGEKNGATRRVPIRKGPVLLPTENRKSRKPAGVTPSKKTQVRKFKPGLDPGRVLIILAGRHRGKRVILLKKLNSGLLLVTGPFVINACPLRRMHQNYVIKTSVKVNLEGINIPSRINDQYFRRRKPLPPPGGCKNYNEFLKLLKKKPYKPDRKRKLDQLEVDAQIMAKIRKRPDKKVLLAYLGSYFKLRNRQYPHKMRF